MKNRKNNFFLAALFAVAASVSSCDNASISEEMPAPSPSQAEEEYATFTVNTQSELTRAIAGTTDENRVESIQVAVYRVNPGYADNGALETCVNASGTTATIKCTVGNKKIYVLANAPDLTDIDATDLIDEKRIFLSNDDRNRFQMCGIKTATIDKTTSSIDISLVRYAARVRVNSIICKFEDYFEASSFVPKSLTLINAVTQALVPEYWISPDASCFANKGQWTTSDVDEMTRSTITGVTLTASGTNAYNTPHSLYTYANSSINTAHSATWAPVCTRLVLEAQIDGITYYYPVNIPGIEANHTYEIPALTITKIGSKNPDIPVETATCSFSIQVKSWDDVNITDGIDI